MLKGKTVAVVVPAYEEELLIGRVIDTMPDYVDNIVIVDDCSKDRTAEIVEGYVARSSGKVTLLRHEVNQGVGGAIATGYKWCRDHDIDAAVVMAGDAQMDPDDLPAILEPVLEDRADYSKGNRLITGDAWNKIPKVRYLGNSMLSLLTKIASGYWHIADSQTGYTAINKKALRLIDWDQMYKRYGQPNDLLVRLNIINLRVSDVEVKPVYNIGEKSGIRPIRIIPRMTLLISRLFLYRMVQKYIIRDFHPLVLFYLAGFLFFLFDLFFLVRFFVLWFRLGAVPEITALFLLFCTFSSLLFILFAMLFDMEYNRDLNGGR
ncbi:MAG: hypothetical protein MHPDNHAH_01275 [Anaerolineales bacterium]|nr:hypothetical protein [Anaerolineales bacterium]WKZ46660.1 MAG: glycosyltransferase family 2 protein [Anaerolineales bacterium]